MWIFGILILIALAATLLYRGRTKMAWILPIGLALGWWGLAGGFDHASWKIVAQGPIDALRDTAGEGATLEELFLGLVGADETDTPDLNWLRG